MQTILDQAHTWFVERISYTECLEVYLIEGKRGEPENLVLGGVDLGPARRISHSTSSRRVRLRFNTFIAWQCTTESADAGDAKGEPDCPGVLVNLEGSDYLEYVRKRHGWYLDIQAKPVAHYCLQTADEIIDVISSDEPSIEEVNA